MAPQNGQTAAAPTTSRSPTMASRAEVTRSPSRSRTATARRARSTEETPSPPASDPVRRPRQSRPGPSSRQPKGGPDLRRGLRHHGIRLVLLALPDEPRGEESVAFVARHDVNVKVRHALADPGVRRDERSLCFERLLHGDRGSTHRAEDRRQQLVREVVESLDVRRRHHQHVAVQERSAVEERDHLVFTMDDLGRELAVSDLAERACHSIVAACTDVTYGKYCVMPVQLSPWVLLPHTSPLAVPK